jgi:serine/threonine protein kinase
MKTLSAQQYESMRSGAKVLSADGHGDKVLLLPDSRVIKLFRRKRWLSSTLWNPYAQRFARASRRLRELDVPAVRVEDVFRIPSLRRHAVAYPLLPGKTLREAASDPDRCRPLVLELAGFLARLHSLGVYFRAIHFGNVLVQPDGSFALIDVSEVRFRRRFGPGLRARNFKPLVGYSDDAACFQSAGMVHFVRAYLEHAQLKHDKQSMLLSKLRLIHPLFDAAISSIRASSGVVAS